MTHPDEDLLLKSVLELLPAEEEQQLQTHLAACDDCRRQHRLLAGEIELIGGLEPALATTLFPMPRRPRAVAVAWLKIAVLLAVAFLAGHAVSRLAQPEPIRVVPHYLQPCSPEVSLRSMSVCVSEGTWVDLKTWVDLDLSSSSAVP